MSFIGQTQITPYEQIIEKGATAMIYCQSETEPTWKFNNVRMKQVHFMCEFKKYCLEIIVFSHSGGRYVCKGTYRNGKQFEAISSLYVLGKI